MTDESLGLCAALMSLGWTLRERMYGNDPAVTLTATKPDTRPVCVRRPDVDTAFAALADECRAADDERVAEWLERAG